MTLQLNSYTIPVSDIENIEGGYNYWQLDISLQGFGYKLDKDRLIVNLPYIDRGKINYYLNSDLVEHYTNLIETHINMLFKQYKLKPNIGNFLLNRRKKSPNNPISRFVIKYKDFIEGEKTEEDISHDYFKSIYERPTASTTN